MDKALGSKLCQSQGGKLTLSPGYAAGIQGLQGGIKPLFRTHLMQRA